MSVKEFMAMLSNGHKGFDFKSLPLLQSSPLPLDMLAGCIRGSVSWESLLQGQGEHVFNKAASLRPWGFWKKMQQVAVWLGRQNSGGASGGSTCAALDDLLPQVFLCGKGIITASPGSSVGCSVQGMRSLKDFPTCSSDGRKVSVSMRSPSAHGSQTH